MPRLLIVEDDEDFRESCCRWFARKGYDAVGVGSGAEAIDAARRTQFDVGIFDMDLPGMSGLEVLQRLRDDGNDLETVFLTGQGTIATAVAAMKLGASDFLTKPCAMADLEHHCRLADQRGRLRRENQQLRAILDRQQTGPRIIGSSPAMRSVVAMIARIAPSDQPVLITGESGTGKEVVAQAIHRASGLAGAPMVTVNCAVLPEQLVESELFGHEKGSFTGATAEKPGLFEIADGGTLFIDELGELPTALQPKLLRVLQDGSMRRIGSAKERRVRVRVVAATNRDLTAEVAAGRFREDLYYRVAVLPVHLPPLRERPGDVDELIAALLPSGFSVDPAAIAALRRHPWPGNVRQLINVLRRASILADGKTIGMSDLPPEVAGSSVPHPSRMAVDPLPMVPVDTPTAAPADAGSLENVQRDHVMRVLADCDGNKAKAARRLGIHRRKLYRLLERFEG